MKYKQEDLSFTSDKYGYMISYKGNEIGGASLYGKPKMHWKHAKANIIMFREQAIKTIMDLSKGVGPAYLLQVIETIEYNEKQIKE
jgi:hypothetical protein